MKIAIVVQRYGCDISGGAELHARYIAELLAATQDVRVYTTCARDYVTWRNDYPVGVETVNGIQVERYAVARERDLTEFGAAQRRVFTRAHTLNEEIEWLDEQGPVSPGLINRIHATRHDIDFFVFFSLRYHQTFYGARAVPDRAVIVPTAEREPAIALAIFQPIMRGVRGIMYNSPEERAMLQALSGNVAVPGVIAGVGSQILAPEPGRARQKFGLVKPFLVYVGRIDPNKGCQDLFDSFAAYLDATGRDLDLVLIGSPAMTIPAHPSIRHLGFVSDQDKFDVIGAAHALVMPSYFESLSMVALEAWALGRPVLANARCDVLVGQCLRSNAGLYYEDASEFGAVVDLLLGDPWLAAALGDNGRRYYAEHYSWPIIERKYLNMFRDLHASGPTCDIGPLPRLGGGRPDIPAASDLLATIPAGPVIHGRSYATSARQTATSSSEGRS